MPIIAVVVILVNSRQNKTRQDKASQVKRRQDDVYIDSLHIMKMTMTTTMTISMTIIIQ